MLDIFKMRAAQIADSVRSEGWRSLFRQMVFFKRAAILVEKDLSEVVERPGPLAQAGLKLLELDQQTLASGAYRFAVSYRHLKALHFVERGYAGFAIARDNVIVGDQWCYVSEATDDPSRLHEDLQRFGFKAWQRTDVYTFDIFVAPSERKHGVSAAFQNNAMVSLRAKGYRRAYGYYFADNTPAIWCTRVTNRWKELRTVSMSRFLIFMRAVPAERPPRRARRTGETGERVCEGKEIQ